MALVKGKALDDARGKQGCRMEDEEIPLWMMKDL